MHTCFYYWDILSFLVVFICFLMFVIFPILFNCKIIPDIEKRIGQKLKFEGIAIYYWVPKFCIPIFWWGEIAIYLTLGYCGCLPKGIKKTYALGVIHYDVKQSPRHEIIISFFGTCVFLLFALLLIFAFYVEHIDPVCK